MSSSSNPIKLGFVGLSAKGQWAVSAHLPALRNSSKYELSAILNSSPASTSEAQAEHKLPESAARHKDLASLVGDKDIDAVAVSVKVPHHAEYVRAGLKAKKDVFCEWPLARNLSEAEELTKLAREAGVRTMIGLQARQSPAVRKAKALVEGGKIGSVVSTTMMGYGGIWAGGKVPGSQKYLTDINNGANLLSIPCMHATDALCWVLGEWTDVRAVLTNQMPKLQLTDEAGKETGEVVPKTSHDHAAITGTLQRGGGQVTVLYEPGMGGQSRKPFYWEIKGTGGTILMGGGFGHLQMSEPNMVLIKPDGTRQEDLGLPDPSKIGLDYNVGEAWKAFAGEGEGEVTTFEDALVRHRMIAAVYKSAETGSSEKYA